VRKSILSLGAALMALTLFLSGCGGKQETKAPAGNEAPKTEGAK
jgi:hypothetical protein